MHFNKPCWSCLQVLQLEELVFGGRPFSGTNEKDLESYGLSDTDSDSDEKDQKGEQRKDAVWCDEDDDVIRVDLVSNKGLRKLGKTQEETIVSGRTYTERLRTRKMLIRHIGRC